MARNIGQGGLRIQRSSRTDDADPTFPPHAGNESTSCQVLISLWSFHNFI
jgi:hypothetical protein